MTLVISSQGVNMYHAVAITTDASMMLIQIETDGGKVCTQDPQVLWHVYTLHHQSTRLEQHTLCSIFEQSEDVLACYSGSRLGTN